MKKVIIGWSIILLGCIILFFSKTPEKVQHEQKQKVKKSTEVVDSVALRKLALKNAIEHLKVYEGFRSNAYTDGDGKPTIGYGHHLLAGENYNNLTEKEAAEILYNDLETRLTYVETTYNVRGDSAIALALFCFNCGESNLEEIVNNGVLHHPKILLKYCHYTDRGVTKKSKKLLARREYEYKLFIN